MARTVRNVVSSISLTSLIVGSLIAMTAQSANANGNQFHTFRDANPGLSKGALHHLYKGHNTAGGGLSIGPVPGRSEIKITPVNVSVENPTTFKDFKAHNPGIGKGALWHMWKSHNQLKPGTISIQPVFPQGSRNQSTEPVLSFQDFKEVNQGIDKHTLKALYKAYASGERGITIGVIPPTGASGPQVHGLNPPYVNNTGSVLTAPMPVNLVTGGGSM